MVVSKPVKNGESKSVQCCKKQMFQNFLVFIGYILLIFENDDQRKKNFFNIS